MGDMIYNHVLQLRNIFLLQNCVMLIANKLNK